MKFLNIKRWGIIALLSALPGSVMFGWVSPWLDDDFFYPTGWYWMYDDEETDMPFFAEPVLPNLPEAPYSDYSIHDNPEAVRLERTNDEPYPYLLPDSFWFFARWHEPGDTLYISPDGWISFDEEAEQGFPTSPRHEWAFPITDPPQDVIAPLWEDFDPTRPSPHTRNRVYYMHDTLSNTLWVEWYRVQHHQTGNEYTFMASLDLGGTELLTRQGECGITFSNHRIHFYYHTASLDWEADSARTGFEDYKGLCGIDYWGSIDTEYDDFHVIRSGYKVAFEYDLAVTDLEVVPQSPQGGEEVEVSATVSNQGYEPEEEAVATCEVWDLSANPRELIWNEQVELGYLETHIYNPEADYKRRVTFPTFTFPQDSDVRILVYPDLRLDECRYNDTVKTEFLSGIKEEDNAPDETFSLRVSGLDSKTGDHRITLSLPYPARVILDVFEVNGSRVASLEHKMCTSGTRTYRWDGRDMAGRKVPAGVYLIRMQAEGFIQTRKLLIK